MMLQKSLYLAVSLCAISANAFAPSQNDASLSLSLSASKSAFNEGSTFERRGFLFSVAAAGSLLLADSASADDGEESFASIAARASQLSTTQSDKAPATVSKTLDDRTAYDFELPIKGESVPFKELIQQEFDADGRAKVKAILVVNMKEDDPISRTNIPEFISLAAKYVSELFVDWPVSILFLTGCNCYSFLNADTGTMDLLLFYLLAIKGITNQTPHSLFV